MDTFETNSGILLQSYFEFANWFEQDPKIILLDSNYVMEIIYANNGLKLNPICKGMKVDVISVYHTREEYTFK